MSHGATLVRAASSIAIAGLLAVGTAGCAYMTPQATTLTYSASDGVNGTVGDVRVLNLLALSEDGEDVAFIGSVVNTGTEAATVVFESVDNTSLSETVRVGAGETVRLGIDEPLLLTGIDAEVGGIVPIYVQYGSEQGSELLVPVLNGDLPEYAEFLP